MVSLVGCLFGSCYVDRQVGRKVFFGWLVGLLVGSLILRQVTR